jgi:hypothetical protein
MRTLENNHTERNTTKNHKIRNTLLTVTFAMGLLAQTAKAQYIGLDGQLEFLRNSNSSDNSSLLSVGTYFSVGSFGNRTAAQVNTLFSTATDSAAFGSILRANYTAAFLNTTSILGEASGDNSSNYFAPGTGFTDAGIIDGFTVNDNIYAVFAQATGSGDYRIGIFAAASYNSSGVAGSQVKFRLGDLDTNIMNLTTNARSSQGAIAVGSGSLGGRSANGFYLGTATSTAVPEPSSMSLMLLGGTALVALRRLRKNV